ncbi:unnamed protein product [Paramecium sonneborni]|uniref:Uncharacterized protein n=1 Tax=Paramecium sonneborni TaxID=65129 RepID=A0A8S1Q303_9CILI|nr:unnamed protein product [Paramecium sonneborni]
MKPPRFRDEYNTSKNNKTVPQNIQINLRIGCNKKHLAKRIQKGVITIKRKLQQCYKTL